MAGRLRTATSLLELRGGFKKKPGKRAERSREPHPDKPLGECPESFNDAERQAWQDLTGWAHNLGVFFESDRVAVELATKLLQRSRTTQFIRNDQGEMYALPGINAGELSKLMAFLCNFGMTPASRSKVNASPTKPAEEGWKKFGT